MKFARVIALSSSIAVALAQSLETLPDCGQLCVRNMLAKAKELGCAEGDSACLCLNIDFAYGIRDCSHQVCGPEQAIPVIAYGSNYCKSVSGSAGDSNTPESTPGLKPSSLTSDVSSTATPTHTQSMNSNATSTLSSTAITSAVVTTISSGDDVETSTIGSATISSSTLVPSSTSSTSSDDDQATSTSSAGAAKQTFYAGFAAVAGIAALVI
ncbi:putative cfem domain-containing protein [Golovinomyces cichoracearum]|uniref:Putative cfem domain-containing protein n=1 Tax=Golovinomyces cichoracearum TaxID=62708 RepID=A0A420J6N3_9PEZI|nr:putative cfem domain-containing protein [Golovinomyces cichoracearum]